MYCFSDACRTLHPHYACTRRQSKTPWQLQVSLAWRVLKISTNAALKESNLLQLQAVAFHAPNVACITRTLQPCAHQVHHAAFFLMHTACAYEFMREHCFNMLQYYDLQTVQHLHSHLLGLLIRRLFSQSLCCARCQFAARLQTIVAADICGQKSLSLSDQADDAQCAQAEAAKADREAKHAAAKHVSKVERDGHVVVHASKLPAVKL